MSTEQEIDAFIASLSESELRRILAVLTYGEHKCQGARIGCCGYFRCEPCHVDHLRSRHGEHAAQFWNRLCQESRSTWNPRRTSGPPDPKTDPQHKPKRPNGHKKVAKLQKVNDPSMYKPVTIEEQIQESINRMNRIIKLKQQSKS